MYSLSRYMIDINIETLSGTTFSLKVSPHESVQSVKAKIQRHEGIPISHQHLIWQSSELDDKCSLHDYNIPNGATIRMVIAIRGGPINTRRMANDDTLLRDVSDLMEIHDDSALWNTESHSNKHVTLLLFRDGDHLNLLRVIDRGEANSPVSGAMSAASMYVPYDEADHDTISLANNLEDILSGATFGSTTDLNSQPKSSSSRPKQLKLVNKQKKSSSIENLKTKEKLMLIKQKLKLKSDKQKDQQTNQVESEPVASADLSKKKQRSKKSANIANRNKENEENGQIEANEVDDDEISDEEYGDEYLDDDEEDYVDDDDDEYEDEEDNHFYPNLSHSSENNNNLESPGDDDDDDDEDYGDDEENELILNKSECLLNEDQQPSDSPSQAGISSSLATTTLPTVNTPPVDNEHIQTPYSGRINKNGILSSKLEYFKNKRTKTVQNDASSFDQEHSKVIKNKDEEVDKTRRQKSKRYEIASFSPTTTILVKTVNLDRKKSIQTMTSEIDNQKDRIVSSSNKKVSFNMNDEKSPIKPVLAKKPVNKLESLYSKSNIEETIITLPEKKNNQLNPILKSANRLEMLKTNMTSSASILRPYQPPNGMVAPVLDKSSERTYSAAKQKQISLSANDLVQASKSTIKLPPVINNTVQSSTDASILMAGSSNNLNSIGLSDVKKKVTDLSRYCYYCKKKTGLASSYMCRCGNNYCTQHRNAEAHSCTFDYKTEGRKLIEQSNPLVAAPKLPKI